METGCSDEKIEHIADLTSFAKMKQAKSETEAKTGALIRAVCLCFLLNLYGTLQI